MVTNFAKIVTSFAKIVTWSEFQKPTLSLEDSTEQSINPRCQKTPGRGMESTNSDYNFRFQSEIQGLRGIAVILVVLYHAGLLFTGGFIGVDVFFVISGYVITGSILHQAAQNRFSWASFVERRVRRLLPQCMP